MPRTSKSKPTPEPKPQQQQQVADPLFFVCYDHQVGPGKGRNLVYEAMVEAFRAEIRARWGNRPAPTETVG